MGHQGCAARWSGLVPGRENPCPTASTIVQRGAPVTGARPSCELEAASSKEFARPLKSQVWAEKTGDHRWVWPKSPVGWGKPTDVNVPF